MNSFRVDYAIITKMIASDKNQGFVLISLILAIVIIAIIFAMYYGGSSSRESVKKTGDSAIEQVKLNNTSEIQNHIEIQNELNSIEQ